MTDAGFWDRIAPKYARDPIRDEAAYEYTLDRTTGYLRARYNVLEIGCGTGLTALRIAPHVASIDATDVSGGMLEVAARRKAEAEVANVSFIQQGAEEATRREGPYDAVLAFNILHLLQEPAEVIAGIHAQVPEGGYFISKTPCLADPSIGLKRYAIALLIPLFQLIGRAPSAVRSLTHAQLEAMIAQAGFEIEEAGSYPAISRYVVARKR